MAAVIEVSPGPNFLLITRNVPTFSLPGALSIFAGFSCSYTMHGTLAIFGISAVLAAEPVLLIIIQLAGACYLLYLGVKSFASKTLNKPVAESIEKTVDILLTPSPDLVCARAKVTPRENRLPDRPTVRTESYISGIDIILDEVCEKTATKSLYTCFRDGALISALNPKITLFYMAAFPQFVQADVDTVSSSYLLVLIHILICAFWTVVVALVLDYALRCSSRKNLVHDLNRYSGFALIGLSMAFFTSAAQAF